MGHGGNRAPINQEYLVDFDSSASGQIREVINMNLILKGQVWQFKWEAGVVGKFVWEASVFEEPYSWEPLVSCEEVNMFTSDQLPLLSGIVSLPGAWLNVGFIKLSWVVDQGGSSGLIQGATRVVP